MAIFQVSTAPLCSRSHASFNLNYSLELRLKTIG